MKTLLAFCVGLIMLVSTVAAIDNDNYVYANPYEDIHETTKPQAIIGAEDQYTIDMDGIYLSGINFEFGNIWVPLATIDTFILSVN